MLTKLTPIETASEIICQRHIIRSCAGNDGKAYVLYRGIDHARLALKCAYRGYMYTRFDPRRIP